MQVQLSKKTVKNLRCVMSQMQKSEETQQLRIPEHMADIGKILGAWGQVLLRGKEWNDDNVSVTGGTMVWVMYQPEGDDQQPQMAQAWLPFQLKWDIPRNCADGKIRVLPLLESIDARSASARKIVVRATVTVMAEANIEEETEIYTPENMPDELCILKKTYPTLLPKECGEKVFEMEEDLTIPPSIQPIDEILRFSFHPELIDQKVLSGKVAFRGSGLLHILYRSNQGELCTWDFEIPFAQYDQLDSEYEQGAQCRVLPVVTGLELDLRPDGQLRLKAGICGQYAIYDMAEITVVEDAYQIHGNIAMDFQELSLPAVLDLKQQTIPVELNLQTKASRILDTAFYPQQGHFRNHADRGLLEVGGNFTVLYIDENDQLQGKTQRWQGEYPLLSASNVRICCDLQPSGVPRTTITSGDAAIKSSLYLDVLSTVQNPIFMVAQMELGERKVPDPGRPGLILQRMGNTTLWDLAKENGSTVDKICKANNVCENVQQGQMLLIPVL